MDSSPFPPRLSSLSNPSRPAATIRPILAANFNISSLLSFGKQTPIATSPVKRKPLPPNSPALAANRNGTTIVNEKLGLPQAASGSPGTSPPLVLRDLDQFPRGQSPLLPSGPATQQSLRRREDDQPTAAVHASPLQSIDPTGFQCELGLKKQTEKEQGGTMRRSKTIALQSISRPSPLKLDLNNVSTNNPTDSKETRIPGGRVSQSFDRKGSASPEDDTSSTDLSENGLSPPPSPFPVSPQTSRFSARSLSHVIDAYKVDGGMLLDSPLESPLIRSPVADHDPTDISQLEAELTEISCELASSIKREMELEDLVEKLQSEASGTNDEIRTSDYYSDSSASSARYVGVDKALKIQDLEKAKRQSEQKNAWLKVDLSQKWQNERARRNALETQVQLLEGQILQCHHEHSDVAALSLKAKELEASLDDAKRRFAEEQKIKENLENMLTALRNDLEQPRFQRDSLRDEAVPQLHAKLPVPDPDRLDPPFDFTRMQQEIEALKTENAALKEARKGHQDIQHGPVRFDTISEEVEPLSCPIPRSPGGLNRSNSLARGPTRAGGLVRSGSLSRSNSFGSKSPIEPRENLVDRMKDVEAQRDALHSAMKALLARHECRNKEFQKQIRALEQERDIAMLPPTPRRLGYEREVRNLRQEINCLRQRADEALTQKLQCEKGLGGLKMDLDRSEQETSTLRGLLKEHDIALPEQLSSSLTHAYKQLQQDRIDAEARFEGDPFSRSLEEEQRLADQLRESADRSEGLARQMSEQLKTNQALRNRLAQTIGRGELNQAASKGQITVLETKLRQLEDIVTSAQQLSDTAIMRHEEEVRILKETHNDQLQRLKGSHHQSPTSPRSGNRRGLTPLVSPIFAQRSPRLDRTTSGPGMCLGQALRKGDLEDKVAELETALENADKEMQQVVGRMNMAQIEVMELQTERDEALKQTKKLQAAIMAEREKVQSLMNQLKHS